MRKFWRDTRGVAAIEAAIVMPVVLFAFLGAFTIMQAMNLRSTTAFVAQACANAGARVLSQQNNGGLPAVQAAAQSVFTANNGLWIFGATPTLGTVTINGSNVQVTVTASGPPLFPMPGLSTLSASVTATD